jgi:hypothetical protein
MEYNWTTSVFIGVNGSALAISITLIVVAALVYMAFLPTSKTETQRRKEDGDPIKSPQGRGNPKEDGNRIKSLQGSTLFIPFIRGTSASMSEQFVDHGGRTGGSAAGGIANDLTATVEKYEAKGYEFQKIETIHVDVSPGCIGALMGKGKEYHPYDYLVFKKTSEPVRGQSA